MNNTKQIEVLGSDENIYTIVSERVGYDTTELSIIPCKVKVDSDYYCSTNVNLHKDIVEQYIESIKQIYAPEIYKISMIHHTLNSKQVNNYFDYLNVLQQINPILSELLHK